MEKKLTLRARMKGATPRQVTGSTFREFTGARRENITSITVIQWGDVTHHPETTGLYFFCLLYSYSALDVSFYVQ